LTNSTPSMPNCSRVILGKSRLEISLAKSALCSDHCANEILKSPILPAAGCPETSAAQEVPIPEASATPPASEVRKKVLRFVDVWIIFYVLRWRTSPGNMGTSLRVQCMVRSRAGQSAPLGPGTAEP